MDTKISGANQPAGEVLAGGNNFLLPNGTFFVELIIFLIVLGVIWRFVVPPIRKVLEERERLVAQTAEDNREATRAFTDAESSYRGELAQARTEASKIREGARAEGQAALDESRASAKQEADGVAAAAASELNAQGDQVAAQLQSGVGPLSQTLADRVLGVSAAPTPLSRSNFADQSGRG